ncbi:MAG: HAD family hydrolase [Acholeplasmatales bacterium]|nr:HAD family hydrolase [Acholeplasmatales bacterium]
MIKHIFFDFNGTIIDDVDLCIGLLNEILENQNKKTVSKEEYKNVFKFPIRQYYIDAGVDFNIESFESLAVKFIEKYQPASLKCGLYNGTVEAVKYFKSKGIKVYILSASEKTNLIEQCNHYGITDLFDDILGIDNIHASSKISIATDFINNNNINIDEAIFVGDTLHDFEVANAMGVNCYLVSCGHQSVDVLSKASVPIISDIKALRGVIDEISN